MHKRAKLLLACITLLIVLTNALAMSMEFDSKITASESNNKLRFMYDNLEENNWILRECHYSHDTSQTSCDISGSPADETTLQKCNVKINATNIGSEGVNVIGVYRFRDNKLIVHVEDIEFVSSFHIFDNCKLVNVVSSVNRKDGVIVELYKIIIYEDGFDIFMPESRDEKAKWHYQSFDIDGKQIGEYTVLPEQLPYRTYWLRSIELVSIAKKHSRGFASNSGYRFYPNGTIVPFADDQYRNIMKSHRVANEIDDGLFYTACTMLPGDSGKSKELGCWQYDVDQARLVFKVQFTPPLSMDLMSIRNLSKGGFLLALADQKSRMTVYVIQPDRPTFIDNNDFGENHHPFRVTDFDEKTGQITVHRFENASTIARGHYFLQNYAYTP